MSRSGRVVGSCELLVVAERVDVEQLVVRVVSAVSLSFVGGSTELPRTLVANVTLHNQLTSKYQVAYTVSVKLICIHSHFISNSYNENSLFTCFCGRSYIASKS